MEIVPIVDVGAGNGSYVVDLDDGGALIVDPERDPRPRLEVTEQRGLRPRFVVETHLHAGFVSGSRGLAAQGPAHLAPAERSLRFEQRPLEDGDRIDLGGSAFEVIATTGHTPEHLAHLLSDGDPSTGRFAVGYGSTAEMGGGP